MCEQGPVAYAYLDIPEMCPRCGGLRLVDGGCLGEDTAYFQYVTCQSCGLSFSIRYDYSDQYEGKEIDGELHQPASMVLRLQAEARALDLLQACRNLVALFPDDPASPGGPEIPPAVPIARALIRDV
jgi:hypothetical protein